MKIVEATLNGRWTIKLPDHRAERPNWYTEQGWEKPRLEKLHDIIKSQKEPVVYYVGAEEGEMPALCQMWGARVILFEPNPKVWSNIKAIWQANKLQTPVCIEAFASSVSADGTDSQAIIYHGNFPPCADWQIEAAHGFKELHNEAEKYAQWKIDEVTETEDIPTIITMDVEGSEFEVLKGAESTITQYKPTIVLSLHPEFLFQHWGVYSRDVRNWIIDRGYTETLLEYEHEVHLLYEPKK